MKKFVSRTVATNRGTRPARSVTQIPCCPSWVETNAMLLPSGDQREFVAFQPEGSKGRPGVIGVSRLRRCSAGRPLGGILKNLSPGRTNQSVLTVWLPSVVDTVYTTHSPSGETSASLREATRRMSAGIIARRGWALMERTKRKGKRSFPQRRKGAKRLGRFLLVSCILFPEQ